MLKKEETISSKQRSGILALMVCLIINHAKWFSCFFKISKFEFFKTSCVLVIRIYLLIQEKQKMEWGAKKKKKLECLRKTSVFLRV